MKFITVCLLTFVLVSAEVRAAEYHVIDDQLSALIERLLDGHSEVREIEDQAAALSVREGRYGGWGDTTVTYRWYAQTPETRVGPQRHAIGIKQPLPIGKRDRYAAQADEHAAASAVWRAESVERRLVAELKRAYFGAAYIQEALAVNLEETALMRRYEQIALKKYATGEGNQQSVVKVQVDINRLFERRAELEQEQRRLEAKLAYLSASTEPTLRLLPIRLARIEDTSQIADIEKTHRHEEHPHIRVLSEDVAATRADVERIRAGTKPLLSLELGWAEVGRRDDAAGLLNPPADNGQDVFSLALGMRFPADRRRQRAELSEASAVERAISSQIQTVEAKHRWAIRDAWVRFDSLGERIELTEGAIVPQSERELSAAEAAYTTGRLTFLDLLDAQQETFQSRLALHRLRTDRWIAAADLEEVLGRPFPATGAKQ